MIKHDIATRLTVAFTSALAALCGASPAIVRAQAGPCASVVHVIDTDPQLGIDASTALIRNDAGRLLIGYTRDRRIKTHACADTACTDGVGTVLPDTNLALGQSLAMVRRLDGRPLLGYLDDLNDDYRLFDCADETCTAGMPRVPDPVGVSGFSGDIAVRPNGLPVVSYTRELISQLWLYHCADATCSSGAAQLVDDLPASVGGGNALAIRSDGAPFIAYATTTGSGALRISACSDASCSTIAQRSVATIGNANAGSIDVVMRTENRAAIAFFPRVGGSQPQASVYLCDDAVCASGTTLPLGPPESEINGERHAAIAQRPDGRLVIAYTGNVAAGGVTLYECDDATCTTGSSSTVDDAGRVGRGLAIDASTAGSPAVGYFEIDSRELRLAQCASEAVFDDGFE